MELSTTRQDSIAIVTIGGLIDMRAADEFERALQAALSDGARSLVIDVSKVELLTSAGIRVLVSTSRRLSAIGGGLIVCGVNAGVQRVFEISGLSSQFRTAATPAESVAALAAAPRQPSRSRLAATVARLLGITASSSAAAPAKGAAPSPLALRVAELIDGPDTRA